MSYKNKVLSMSPLAYWPLSEQTGTTIYDVSSNANNGSLVGDVSLGDSGLNGLSAVGFDISNTGINILSGIKSTFNGNLGSFSLWARVNNKGVWTDGNLGWFLHLWVNVNNYVRVIKLDTPDNRIQFRHRSDGDVHERTVDIGPSIEWFQLGMTWNKTDNRIRFYTNGVQLGSDLAYSGNGFIASDLTIAMIGAEKPTGAELNTIKALVQDVDLFDTELNIRQMRELGNC